MNAKAGTHYTATAKLTQEHINARLNDGFTVDDFKKVIDNKCSDWLKTKFSDYLRPQTLFGTKFESYLNQQPKNRSASYDIEKCKNYCTVDDYEFSNVI